MNKKEWDEVFDVAMSCADDVAARMHLDPAKVKEAVQLLRDHVNDLDRIEAETEKSDD